MYIKRRILNYCWQNPKANKSLQIGGKILHAFLEKRKRILSNEVIMTSTLVWGSISEWIAITEIFVLGANKKPGLFYLETVDLNRVPCSSTPTGPRCLETLVWGNRWQSLFCTPILISSLLKYNADARYWNWLGINTVFQMISLLMII